MLRTVAVAGMLLVGLAPAASAKEWAQKMFTATSHDFGHVARGAKAEFSFEITNLYQEDVHIADVRTSCGCTTPTITKNTLKTWEKGAIVATLNTRSFLGQRSSTLTVVIDRPYYAEVYLNIAGNIHGDVDFQPGAVSFGDLDQGTPAEQQVQVTYRGYTNWQITDVRSANGHLEVELGEPQRQYGQTIYKMTVRLKPEAPAGSLQNQLTLVTNDPRVPLVSLAVEGRVAPPLVVSPSPLLFGMVAPGQTVTKQLVVTAKQPFQVLSVTSDHESLAFKPAAGVAKKVHLIPVTLTASEQPGEVKATIKVETDLAVGGEATCLARAAVRGAPAADTAASARVSDGPSAR